MIWTGALLFMKFCCSRSNGESDQYATQKSLRFICKLEAKINYKSVLL